MPHVRRRAWLAQFSAAAKGDQHVVCRGKILELLDEDGLEALIVAPGQNGGDVIGQADDLESLPRRIRKVGPLERRLGEVFANVRGIGSASAVAAEEHKPPLFVG
jgi:hypothetical protein